MIKNKKNWIAILLLIIGFICLIFSANDKMLCFHVISIFAIFLIITLLANKYFVKKHDMNKLKNKVIMVIVDILISGIMLAVMYMPHFRGLI